MKVYTTIYSDGSVRTLDNDSMTVHELSGTLDVLPVIYKAYLHNRPVNVKNYDPPYNFDDLSVVFQVIGEENFITIPINHFGRFVNYIKSKDFNLKDAFDELRIKFEEGE